MQSKLAMPRLLTLEDWFAPPSRLPVVLCTLHTVCVAMAAAQRAGSMVIVAQQKLSVSSDCDDGAKMTMHFVYLCRAIGALLARGRVRAFPAAVLFSCSSMYLI